MKIRKRELRGYAKEAQGYTSWIEYQVVDGKRIVKRFDMLSQAEEFLAALASMAE
jgi:hypothetical protein